MIQAEVSISVTESGRKSPQYSLEGDLHGEFSLADLLAFTKQSLIIIADTVLREEQDIGFDKNPVVVVDGRLNKPVINVGPLGSIEFIARADMNVVLLDIYTNLLEKSPVLTGEYKSSNYVFWNGKQVATDLNSLQSWLDTSPAFDDKDLIRFVDIQPYARKLERLGVTAQRQQSRTSKSTRRGKATVVRVKQPNGVYYLTARAIRSKYKRNSIIQFEFIPGSQLGLKSSFASKKGKPGRTYLYPSILISVQESGVT